MAKNSNSGNILVPVLLIGGAAAVIWASTGSKLKKLEVAFRSFSTDIKLNFPYVNIPVNIEITNPNKTTLTFSEINCNVIINNSKVSTIKYNSPVVLKANSVTTIKKILIQIELFAAADKALDIISKSVSVQIKGYLKADKMSYPVDSTIQIS